MFAGFSEIDITPKPGSNMPGSFDPYRTKRDSIGKLFSSAVAFTSKGNSLILISVDILSFKESYINPIRERISRATGVPVKNILIAAIHTHTGPGVAYKCWNCPPEPEVAADVAEGIYRSGVEAWENRADASIGVGLGYEQRFSFNRDYYLNDGRVLMNCGLKHSKDIIKRGGKVDYSVNVMRVDGADGNIKCFIVNYANHPDCGTDDGSRDRFSADFVGFMRRALKAEYGDAVKVLFFNGTAGDINCLDYFEEKHRAYCNFADDSGFDSTGAKIRKNPPELIGKGLAETVIKINSEIKANVTEPSIDTVSEVCRVKRRKITPQMIAWAKDVEATPTEDKKYNIMHRAWADEYLHDPVAPDTPDYVELEVHTIVIGPWAIVGLPGEIYTEIGLRIKAQSPFEHTLIFELANGTNGYIAPARSMMSGVYETTYSKYNSYTGIETADRLVTRSLEQLEDIDRIILDREVIKN